MTDAHDAPTPTLADRFSPGEVRRILERATEIDADGSHSDTAELIRIAREAGIDTDAMERAIAEVRAEGPTPMAVAPRGRAVTGPTDEVDTSVQSILAGAGVGLGVGAMIAMFTPLIGLALGGLVVFSLVRALQLGERGALLEFELQHFVASLVAALSALPFLSSPDDELLAGVAVVWLVVSFLGGAIVWWRGRGGDEPENGSP